MQLFFAAQLQRYTFSPIHLKDDTKQNKNNNTNEHKQDPTKGG
jgi:hypothetical protein